MKPILDGKTLGSPKDRAEAAVKPGDWNNVGTCCKGDSIQLRSNGLLDSTRLKSVIALQPHQGPPMMVWFPNLETTPLD